MSPTRVDENRDLLVILGAGPSLRSINHDLLNKVPVFILNYGYRLFIKRLAHPRYFGSFDSNVVSSIWRDVHQLAVSTHCKTEAFFMLSPPQSLTAKLPSNVVPCIRIHSFPDDTLPNPMLANPLGVPFYFSGVNAAYSALLMGYKTLLLAGVDCHYKPCLTGIESLSSADLSVSSAMLSNSNYFTDMYHLPGDKISDPSVSPSQHGEWKSLFGWASRQSKSSPVRIFNIAPGSPFNLFPRALLSDFV